jgi:hypothetical protein
VTGFVEFLVEKALAQTVPGIGKKRIDRAAGLLRGVVKAIDAFRCGEIGFDGDNRRSHCPEIGRSLGERPISGDHQIEAVRGALLGELVTDAGRGAGDDRERPRGWHWAISV